MPPTHTDEGIAAAQEIRRAHPEVGVLVLSQYLESRYAMRLLEEAPDRIGYLLKDRVSDIAVLADALKRIGEGECVIDPTIVSRLVQAPAGAGAARRADRARARGAAASWPRGARTGPSAGALPEPEDGRGERAPDLQEARAPAVARRPPPRAGGPRLPARGSAGLTSTATPGLSLATGVQFEGEPARKTRVLPVSVASSAT